MSVRLATVGFHTRTHCLALPVRVFLSTRFEVITSMASINMLATMAIAPKMEGRICDRRA